MSKANPSVDSTGSISLAQFPPPVSLDSALLSWFISLPANPLIVYAAFTPAPSVDPHLHLTVIEAARRSLVSINNPFPILNALLPSVQITHQSSALYVFAISSADDASPSHANLNSLSFENLIASGSDSFTPRDLYPCSVACSALRNPCPKCLNPKSFPSASSAVPSLLQPTLAPLQSSISAKCLLPRHPLREAYLRFLQSVRDHIIQRISEPGNDIRFVAKYSDGFLLGPSQNFSEWGAGWDHHSSTRTLIHCQLEIHLSPSRLTVHPIPRPTYFLPLLSSLPISPGSPLKLLPYGTPAFYLTTYTGPTPAITAQFEASLAGFGAGDWKSANKTTFSCSSPAKHPLYVICWISVQNKQGEEKGITVIWPASLCVSFFPSSPQAKQVLPYIPELPAQLQPSPPSSSLASIQVLSLQDTDTPLSSFQGQSRRVMMQARTDESFKALRLLTLSNTKNMHEIAHEVSSFVDSVAKEREKERERIRKEREQAQSPPKPIPTPRTPFPTSASSTITGSLQSSVQQSQTVEPDNIVDSVPLVVSSGEAEAGTLLLQTEETASPEHHITTADNHQPVTTTASSHNPAISYDPFTTFDASWSRTTAGFTPMEMDYDMGFGINMNTLAGRGSGGSERFNMDIDDGFGAFTDDDFSFFDRPAPPVIKSEDPSFEETMIITAGLTSPTTRLGQLDLASPLFSEGNHGTGPGPPPHSAIVSQSHPSTWTSEILGEGFTPRFSNSHILVENTPIAPLLPSSPIFITPSTYCAPTPPTVHVAHDFSNSSIVAKRPHSVSQPTLFEPIPFALSHRMADAKYAFGKFSLPSPPDEEDRTECFSSFYPKANSWKTKYNAVTDPRVSVVRKLIGAKRKITEQGCRDGKVSPSWVRDLEEWQSSIIDSPDDDQSDIQSDDENNASLEEDDAMLNIGVERPSTPTPSYLPFGPSLLATQFHHAHLLPMSTALRPPGAAVAATNLGAAVAPISVPTPVSPPAMLGEKSRSLEAAANMLAKEVIENCVWAESYRLNSLHSLFTTRPSTDICQVDVTKIVRLFEGVEGLKGPLEIGTLFDLGSASLTCTSDTPVSLQVMESPLLSVGKSDVVIEILPPALRFWEKLGLNPRGGVKNVIAYVFFEEQDDERLESVSKWLDKISVAYSARNFGTHTAGTSSSCLRDGVLPVRFESFRKTLPSFIADIPPSPGYIVFYIATPASMISLASPVLRQIFSAAKRAMKSSSDSQIHFQFVSESLVLGSTCDDPTGCRLDAFVSSVYDRILKPVDRSMFRREHGEKVRKFFHEPSFTLGRPRQPKVTYVQQAPVLSLDVLDRHTLLHVGYRLSSCGKWLFAACVDQRGESHELGVWLNQHEEGSTESFLVGQLWNFTVNIAKNANVEWRIVFAKLGTMGEREMDAWITKLASSIPKCKEIPMMHVTVISAELDAPWTFITPGLKALRSQTMIQQKNPTGTRFEDISATTYALLPPVPMALSPVALRCKDPGVNNAHFVADHDDAPSSDMSVRVLSTATIIRVPADTDYTSISMLRVDLLHTVKSSMSSLNIADEDTHLDIINNFHELTILAKARWKLGKVNPILPFHLAALEVMDETLSGELPLD